MKGQLRNTKSGKSQRFIYCGGEARRPISPKTSCASSKKGFWGEENFFFFWYYSFLLYNSTPIDDFFPGLFVKWAWLPRLVARLWRCYARTRFGIFRLLGQMARASLHLVTKKEKEARCHCEYWKLASVFFTRLLLAGCLYCEFFLSRHGTSCGFLVALPSRIVILALCGCYLWTRPSGTKQTNDARRCL